jgi:hypothetical protein
LPHFGTPIEKTARLSGTAAPSENDYEPGRTLPSDFPVSSCEEQPLEIKIKKKVLIEY